MADFGGSMIKKEKWLSRSFAGRDKPWRQLWHLAGGSFFPILAFFVPIEIVRISLGIITAFFVIWEVVRLSSPRVNAWMVQHLRLMMKKEESYRPTGTTWLLVASMIVFCLFDKFVAITSLLFLSIGDLMARMIGQKFGRKIIFSKSLEGSGACLV